MANALTPTSAAVFALLMDLAAAGGVHEEIPQPATFPLVWFELRDARDRRGFGMGSLPEIELRTHVYSTVAGRREGQDLDSDVVDALKDAALDVEGFEQCGRVFYDDTVQLPGEELNGVKVHEIVSSFRIFLEPA